MAVYFNLATELSVASSWVLGMLVLNLKLTPKLKGTSLSPPFCFVLNDFANIYTGYVEMG